eukprot:TRINITY_DN2191_c0_g1_i1.p1 TRINITY_DN2191_c0_g1~~TRINITY_DN2191_c0_g1_i1.p1  ORF type:complete len:395 (-),score=74.96 TRINITY_DN2191_c0_g1_i1:65-1249(-)
MIPPSDLALTLDIEGSLSNLESQLRLTMEKAIEAKLEEEKRKLEEKLRKEREELELIKNDEIVYLNVGGAKYATYLRNILRAGPSLLADIATGVVQVPRDAQGNLFIDRNETTFQYVLDYLRDNERNPKPNDVSLKRRIDREMEYFKLVPTNSILPAFAALPGNLDPFLIFDVNFPRNGLVFSNNNTTVRIGNPEGMNEDESDGGWDPEEALIFGSLGVASGQKHFKFKIESLVSQSIVVGLVPENKKSYDPEEFDYEGTYALVSDGTVYPTLSGATTSGFPTGAEIQVGVDFDTGVVTFKTENEQVVLNGNLKSQAWYIYVYLGFDQDSVTVKPQLILHKHLLSIWRLKRFNTCMFSAIFNDIYACVQLRPLPTKIQYQNCLLYTSPSPRDQA